VNNSNPLYAGKAKTLYPSATPQQLICHFRDDTSAFDGQKMEPLKNKGLVNNYFNAFIMQYLSDLGIETHFIQRENNTDSLVKALTMIPVECVVRNVAAGSLCRRLGTTEGQRLTPPVFEFFLKNDALHDPFINEHHIRTFGWATDIEIQQMQTYALQINQHLTELFKKANIILVDYKLEFGRLNHKIVLGDEFTPDGCRLWDQSTLHKLDKDRFRKGLGNVVESYIEVAQRLGITLPIEAKPSK
jgi:phosphoribosylaminoimidazole-succinocarboxamide synthase